MRHLDDAIVLVNVTSQVTLKPRLKKVQLKKLTYNCQSLVRLVLAVAARDAQRDDGVDLN